MCTFSLFHSGVASYLSDVGAGDPLLSFHIAEIAGAGPWPLDQREQGAPQPRACRPPHDKDQEALASTVPCTDGEPSSSALRQAILPRHVPGPAPVFLYISAVFNITADK